MGKVQPQFFNGSPGAVSRAVDDIIISVRNAGGTDIPFGAPVFMTNNGAAPFNTASPQDFSAFLGFAVRVADKTPDVYPTAQFGNAGNSQNGVWHPGDVMEVLVRGSIAVPTLTAGSPGGAVYLRKNDGQLTPLAGSEGSTVLLENVRIRKPRSTACACSEVVVNKRNII